MEMSDFDRAGRRAAALAMVVQRMVNVAEAPPLRGRALTGP
jgi:hypothetical protein